MPCVNILHPFPFGEGGSRRLTDEVERSESIRQSKGWISLHLIRFTSFSTFPKGEGNFAASSSAEARGR